ncbi:MAG: NAD(P)-dependent oxidoreductase [Burkholderiaceae bacterium]
MNDSLGPLGFVGLGQMGQPMAANIAKAGYEIVGFDIAGTDGRLPAGARAAGSLAELATQTSIAFVSVPDGRASLAVARDLAAARGALQWVIDLSTIGPTASREAAALLSAAGVGYVDAPVSGGRSGAVAASISLMWAGDRTAFERLRPVLDAFTGNPFHVGDTPGQGQAIKLLNNFLSATAMAATSEAVLFGLSQGLDMKSILAVVNVSSGRNTASADKFPNRVSTGTFDAGFASALLAKDVQLYRDQVALAGTPGQLGSLVGDIWNACAAAGDAGTDFTHIFTFLRDGRVPRE